MSDDKGHPSESLSMGIENERFIEILFEDQIWGPLRGCMYAVRMVAMFWAVMAGQRGVPFVPVAKAMSCG